MIGSCKVWQYFLAVLASSSTQSKGISPKKNKSAESKVADHGPRKGINYSISAFDDGMYSIIFLVNVCVLMGSSFLRNRSFKSLYTTPFTRSLTWPSKSYTTSILITYLGGPETFQLVRSSWLPTPAAFGGLKVQVSNHWGWATIWTGLLSLAPQGGSELVIRGVYSTLKLWYLGSSAFTHSDIWFFLILKWCSLQRLLFSFSLRHINCVLFFVPLPRFSSSI